MAESDDREISGDREFGFMIIDRLEQNLGVPLRQIFENEASAEVIRQQFRSAVINAVREQAAAEPSSEDWPNPGDPAHLAQLDAAASNIIPPIAVTESNLRIIRGYTGSQIHDYVRRASNGLSLIKDDMSAGEIAGVILGSGLTAFATRMIQTTILQKRAGATLRTALTAGVRAMGAAKMVAGVAALIIVELLLFLMAGNQKVFLGIVFNDTDLNLVVKDWRSGLDGDDAGDLYMSMGKMTAFMDTHENDSLDSPVVQIPARAFNAPNDPDNLVMGGLFEGEKKFGLNGTDGVMVLADRQAPLPRFFLQFACPYTRANGVNVTIDGSGSRSPKDLSSELFNDRGLDKTCSYGAYTFQARCNSEKGGVAAGIAVLSAAQA